jgi:hypothetical protein
MTPTYSCAIRASTPSERTSHEPPSRKSQRHAARRRRQCPQARAIGRVEAQRRALNDAEHGASIRDAMVPRTLADGMPATFLPADTARGEPIGARSTATLFARNTTRSCARRRRLHRHERCAMDDDMRTTADGVNDPVAARWGHPQGKTAGSFTPSLVHRLRHRRQNDGGRKRRLADARAATSCERSACACFAIMEPPGDRRRREKAWKSGGSPDAIFAWPLSWPMLRGRSRL